MWPLLPIFRRRCELERLMASENEQGVPLIAAEADRCRPTDSDVGCRLWTRLSRHSGLEQTLESLSGWES